MLDFLCFFYWLMQWKIGKKTTTFRHMGKKTYYQTYQKKIQNLESYSFEK